MAADDTTDSAAWAAGARRGEQLGRMLAEAGMAGRSLGVWLGPHAGPRQLCSPYARDLAALWMEAARRESPAALEALIGAPEAAPGVLQQRARLVAAASLCTAKRPELLGEQRLVERQVGIDAIDGLSAVLIDTRRLDWPASLMPNGQAAHTGEVLVQLATSAQGPTADAAALVALGHTLPHQLCGLVHVAEDAQLGPGRVRRGEPGGSTLWQAWQALAEHKRLHPEGSYTIALSVAQTAPLLGALRAAATWLASPKR